MAKKSRNVLKETSKKRTKTESKNISGSKETAETPDKETDESLTTSDRISKSRTKTPIELKREKDREHQQAKRDRDKGKNTEQAEREAKVFSLAIEQFSCMPFDVLSKRDKIWILTPEERSTWTLSCKTVLDKYSGFLAGFSAETSLALVLGSILIPRLSMNGEKKEPDISSPGKEGDGQDLQGETNDRVSQ